MFSVIVSGNMVISEALYLDYGTLEAILYFKMNFRHVITWKQFLQNGCVIPNAKKLYVLSVRVQAYFVLHV